MCPMIYVIVLAYCKRNYFKIVNIFRMTSSGKHTQRHTNAFFSLRKSPTQSKFECDRLQSLVLRLCPVKYNFSFFVCAEREKELRRKSNMKVENHQVVFRLALRLNLTKISF